jgi:hypothetical protein
MADDTQTEEAPENLIDAAKPETPPTGEPSAPAQPDAAEWLWAEGVKGTDKPPEWFDAKKYKTVAEQAKAYPELFKKHGELASKLKGFQGAPEQYEMSMPEELKEQMEWNADDPLLSEFQTIAKEAGMSQETFVKCLHTLAKYEYANIAPDWKREKELLGDRADQRLQGFWDWANANFDPESTKTIQRALGINPSPGEIFMAMEIVQNAHRQPSVNKPGDDVAPSLTLADVDRMQSDPRWATDPQYRDEVRAKRRQVVGDGDYKEIVGRR